ncbi:uncharacterized protein A1O9_05771 [Exophiala aquamarina CBS 119918]|uniref:Cut9 interacting protein Scn1 n=1 Tax=Exophiala aquamarina CBS 119918 TaxID=1182545 RepID=A0A072PQS6_9EURO|nr:uncharacterized protein A1O9_05771 [Exophiala aquamarina CBS 119918]KEF57850.1 hypothetical protein A1O9_05771 [Exophiala aquamarina CBS 119918]
MEEVKDEANTIWDIGVFDAHCHPTDIMASTGDIASMKARALTIMATRSQDQKLVEDTARKYSIKNLRNAFSGRDVTQVVLPAFGWHPWFSHELYDDRESKAHIDAVRHYRYVLAPEPEDLSFISALPSPISLTQYLNDTEQRLKDFPLALVGEVGLDRAFRLPDLPAAKGPTGERCDKSGGSTEEYTAGSREGRPLTPYRVNMEHQKVILRAQLDLAAKMNRAVSLHSVQAHGVVFDLLQAMWKGHEKPSKREKKKLQPGKSVSGVSKDQESKDILPYPPRICMHSYSGPPDALKQFFNPKVPTDFYFSFSTAINFPGSRTSTDKATKVIELVPDDRILIESDLHCAGQMMDDLLKDIVLKVCDVKQWPLTEGAEQLKQNWMKFAFG